MASQGCLGLIKYFLFLFNLLFSCLGALLLSLGIWIVLAETSFFMPAPPYMSFSVFSYFLVIGGSATMSLGFIGCLGALKEVKCMLGMYFILLTILLAAQIVGAVLLFTQRTSFESKVEEHVLHLIASFGKNDSNYQNFEKTLDYVQQEIHCCGWIGPNNWVEAPCSCYHPINNTQNASISSEMCDCNAILSLSNYTMCDIYQTGCRENIREWLDENMLITFGVLLAVMTVEVRGDRRGLHHAAVFPSAGHARSRRVLRPGLIGAD
ncbi:leukocyte antigen CD37 isoform X2 [Coregonus clupeaformis]|uniref:leukocyte antigen CD37 isoform X2 n=1 Tax=Coregonus clupeaformis TaxID=59861 RepID=UPI001E1C5BE5|nr:leukocyte antigen CD37 isoform X2 [Coregonus clupeaformis]